MNNFTIDELTILHECIEAQLPTTKGIGKQFVLEMLADKCIEAKIDLGCGQESLDDKIRREYPLKECV